MFTLFHLLRLLGAVGGVTMGAGIGWHHYGIAGALCGAVIGLLAGSAIGHLPLFVCARLLYLKYREMSAEELRQYLHDESCRTPNFVLLELNRRGESIIEEVPLVFTLLTSDDYRRRCAGWAALTSAFPALASKLPECAPNQSLEECRNVIAGLTSSDIDSLIENARQS